jgi:hypothetical protein
MTFPVPVDSTTSAHRSHASRLKICAAAANPRRPRSAWPDRVAWDAATRALSRAAACQNPASALRYCDKIPLLHGGFPQTRRPLLQRFALHINEFQSVQVCRALSSAHFPSHKLLHRNSPTSDLRAPASG